ncbi:MAG: type 1 glutamine amidotransferase [bacterium]|nr:type 1 glutamine amidotransferase [bacterium]
MKVLVFQADQREPLEEFPCEWIVRPFLSDGDTFEIIDCLRQTPTLNLDEYDSFVITGSKFQVTEDLPWIQYLLDQSKQILALQKPILGICFGHQLLAYALGAEVKKNEKGSEIGMVTVSLTVFGGDAQLFSDVADQFQVFSYHDFEVTSFSNMQDIVILGKNDHSSIQAFCYKNFAFGVQFHPEITFERARQVVQYRKGAHNDPTIDYDAMHDALASMPEPSRVMENFYRLAISSPSSESTKKGKQ